MKELIRKVQFAWRDTRKPRWYDWTVFGLTALFIFCSFMFGDILITTSNGINFWDCVAKGNLLDFYKVNYHQFFGQPDTYCASYEFPIYVLFGLWDFPLWIASRFFKVDILSSIPALIWAKSILVVYLAGAAVTLYRICIQLKMSADRSKWAVYLFVSTTIVFACTLFESQYDIVSVFFTLLGILCLLKKKTIPFLLLFSIAISMKLFALFIFIPLLLLSEKRMIRLAAKLIAGLGVLGICKLLFRHAPLYKASTSGLDNGMFGRLWAAGMPSSYATASFFAILLVFICIFAYLQDHLSEEEFGRYVIYIPLVTYSAFFAFVFSHPQWIVILSPYIAVAMMQNVRRLKISLFVDMLFSGTYLLLMYMDFYWCYGTGVIDYIKIIPTLFGGVNASARRFANVSELLAAFQVDGRLMPLLCGVYVASLAAFLILNFPFRQKPEAVTDSAENSDGIHPVDRSVVWLRTVIIVPFALLSILSYYWMK